MTLDIQEYKLEQKCAVLKGNLRGSQSPQRLRKQKVKSPHTRIISSVRGNYPRDGNEAGNSNPKAFRHSVRTGELISIRTILAPERCRFTWIPCLTGAAPESILFTERPIVKTFGLKNHPGLDHRRGRPNAGKCFDDPYSDSGNERCHRRGQNALRRHGVNGNPRSNSSCFGHGKALRHS